MTLVPVFIRFHCLGKISMNKFDFFLYRKFAGKTPLALAQNKPEILEIIKCKYKHIYDIDNKVDKNDENFTKQEISKLLNESDNSDQNDVANIDLQVFKPKRNFQNYSNSLDFENTDLFHCEEGLWGQQQGRRRHISESAVETKAAMSRSGSLLYSSHSSSLDLLPRIEQVRE